MKPRVGAGAISRLWQLVRPLVPPIVRAKARRLLGTSVVGWLHPEGDHRQRMAEEVARFDAEAVVHDLPAIYHYWSNTCLRPRIASLGFENPGDFFAKAASEVHARTGGPVDIVSVGAGNCDTEVQVARLLRARGVPIARITCADLNVTMLDRGRALAQREGFADVFAFRQMDLNQPGEVGAFDLCMANQILHHVVDLETLLDAIAASMADHARFAVADMIGRNGHQRWPEAKVLVDRFWSELPKAYRYNRQLARREHRFKDWDCSVEGFEGIRAQDILPLLVERFGFDLFYAFGNVIDPFIDRSFGPNFDADAAWDRDFIDRVDAADEAAIDRREISPTHLFAILARDRSMVPRTWRARTPAACIRVPPPR